MSITINGEQHAIESDTPFSVSALLDKLGFRGQTVLVELNGTALHQRDFDTTHLAEGDKIELIRIVAGG